MCHSNIRQVALAATNYQSAHGVFPSCTGMAEMNGLGSSTHVSLVVQVLPFLDDAKRYTEITSNSRYGGNAYSAFPPLYAKGYEPWEREVPILVCSSTPEFDSGYANTQYGFCIGDRARNIADPTILRGTFAGSKRVSFEDVGDGSSNTMMIAEIGARSDRTRENRWAINRGDSILDDPSECHRIVSQTKEWNWRKGVQLSSVSRGAHWADGRAGVALFNTILPPNSPSVAVGRDANSDGIYSASSPHSGGVNVARMDGSVAFIDEDIDAGDSSSPTPTEDEMKSGVASPYGVWGALGTINGGEVVDEF